MDFCPLFCDILETLSSITPPLAFLRCASVSNSWVFYRLLTRAWTKSRSERLATRSSVSVKLKGPQKQNPRHIRSMSTFANSSKLVSFRLTPPHLFPSSLPSNTSLLHPEGLGFGRHSCLQQETSRIQFKVYSVALPTIF